ncbi:MAG: glycosyl hydrolase 53 family protein, partial [Oscillospiraceae bacterium]|nr:glycosyl hydrolase 53 family protein [Oscillospiraceae bacterium]
MRKLVCALLALLAALTLCACAEKSADKSKEVQSETLYVKKVDGLSDDFILGMDASSVIAEERSGVKYYSFDGEEQDVFQTLAENGVTHIRVRVWNHPYDAAGHGYGGGNCDIGNAVEIGSRAAKYGMKLIVDF